jgi:bifunctional DNA-binding transcriptional regulator/antitoxin component of YhaV-PrlF toxin-antitoxin module
MGNGATTILTYASSKSKSLRATVPSFIIKQFGLDAGDKVEWSIRAQDDQLIIVVKPIKSKQETDKSG